MTKIVSTIAIAVLILSGCTANNDNSTPATDNSRRAMGIETKTGQGLTAKELCSEIKTDASGQTTLDSILFNKNSSFVKRTLLVDSQIQLVPISTSKGYWGFLNDTILFNEKGVQSSKPIKTVENSNGITCYQIGSGTDVKTYCPCN